MVKKNRTIEQIIATEDLKQVFNDILDSQDPDEQDFIVIWLNPDDVMKAYIGTDKFRALGLIDVARALILENDDDELSSI